MNIWLKAILAICIAVSGTQSAFADEPSEKDIRNALAFEIPPVWKVVEFEVEAMQNVGSKIDPVIKSRFQAELVNKDETFIRVARYDGIPLLKSVFKAGTKQKIFGFSTSRLYQGSWKTSFEFQGKVFENAGQPRSAFPGKTLIAGSDEHTQFVEANEAAKLEREQAARAKAITERKAREAVEAKHLELSAVHFADRENIFNKGVTLQGTHDAQDYGARRKYTPFLVQFFDYDAKSGRFKGKMSWPSGAVLSIAGVSTPSMMRFTETGWINNPKRRGNTFHSYYGSIGSGGIEGDVCSNNDLSANCRKTPARFKLQLPKNYKG